MKINQSCTNKVVACSVALLAMAWATELSAQTTKQGMAKVTAVKGAARYTTDNKTWQPVKVGLAIKSGSVIQTAKDSHVDIVLGGGDGGALQPAARRITFAPGGGGGGAGEQGNVVRITANTILAIDKLTMEETGADVVSEIQLDLRAGRIMGNVKKLSAASRYEVKFPTGIAGIRGTTYIIDASGAVSVIAGTVVVSYMNTNGVVETKVVKAGQQFDPATEEVTPIPNFDPEKMSQPFQSMGGSQNGQLVTVAGDTTQLYVSPTIGNTGSGGPF